MEANNDLYDYDISCPQCGKKTMKKTIGFCHFTICEDYLNCDYSNIDEIVSIAIDPTEERIEEEKQWYGERLRLFVEREEKRIKREFIAREMKRLKETGL